MAGPGATQAQELVLYANSSGPAGIAIAQVLAYNLKQIGIDVEVRYFDTVTLTEKSAIRGSRSTSQCSAGRADYAEARGVSRAAPQRRRCREAGALTTRRVTRRVDAANRLTGEARRRAWADLDVDLMRNNPPWAPPCTPSAASFVSRSTGCVLIHPVYGFDIAAVCKK